MGITGNKRFYSYMRKRVVLMRTPDRARNYREADDVYKSAMGDGGKFAFVKSSGAAFRRPVTVLDLGCGTGRYFHCFDNLSRLVGVDCSRHMLEEAKNPVIGVKGEVSLVESSIHEVEFKPAQFDIVYCMGVFGGSIPFDEFLAEKISSWLKPEGVLYFDVIARYLNPSRGTWKSRAAELIAPYLIGLPRRYVEARLGNFVITEERTRTIVAKHFAEVSASPWQGKMRLDFLCIARKPKK